MLSFENTLMVETNCQISELPPLIPSLTDHETHEMGQIKETTHRRWPYRPSHGETPKVALMRTNIITEPGSRGARPTEN